MRIPRKTMGPIYWLLALSALLAVNHFLSVRTEFEAVPYSQFLEALHKGKVKRVEIQRKAIRAEVESDTAKKGRFIVAERLPALDESKLIDVLKEQKVEFKGKIDDEGFWGPVLLGWMLPLGIMLAIYFFGVRMMSKGGGPLTIGRNRAKVYDESKSSGVTFAHVAGIDESVAEMKEVVDFLKAPKKYETLGATIPKGVLLVGPPGTGKTLLARAIAGEAKVPFFSLSGSDFVEMFVGVGAARVRDLFEQARKRSPCIIFIDEIDAIGKSRGGVATFGSHDEREQTLNQLLSEMDGFDASSGVVIIAATNRPEVLDTALVRSGRFDRQVLVDRPDVTGRNAILDVHAKKLTMDERVDLQTVARRTSGMVGADLAKVVNEAALSAARHGASKVRPEDFEEAVDRIQLGLKKQGRAMNEEEKKRVAIHESGHALVAMSVENADPVHRVSIIPRSIGALGVTLQLPTEDRYLMLKSELLDRICVMLGGRAAEAQELHDVSTGAENDLERATETARQMACRFGMSDALGPQTFGRTSSARFLEGLPGASDTKNYSEDTSRLIDTEVRHIIDEQYERARRILKLQQPLLQGMTERLLAKETLDREALAQLKEELFVTEGRTENSKGVVAA